MPTTAEDLYLHLPRPLKRVALTAKLTRVERKRYSKLFHAELTAALDRLKWDQDQLEEFNASNLSSFVKDVVPTSPFWQKRFADAGLKASDIADPSDLERLPVVTKLDVRMAGDRVGGIRSRTDIKSHTSGTTGAGLTFRASAEAAAAQWAVWWRHWTSNGIDFGTPRIQLGGRRITADGRDVGVKLVGGRGLYLSAYHLSDATMLNYVQHIESSGLTWLHGYPSSISYIASWLVARERTLPLRFVTLGAENVTNQMRTSIRKAFDVQPIEHYGLAEGVANASRCGQGNYHVDEDFSIVELPQSHGSRSIVGTAWRNTAFPFIRYDSGDIASLMDWGFCSCGRLGRALREIDGRSEDYVTSAGGRRIGRLDHIFKDQTWIREAQIVQREAGSITVRVLPESSADVRAGCLALDNELSSYLGKGFSWRIETCHAIPRTRSGKLRLVIDASD